MVYSFDQGMTGDQGDFFWSGVSLQAKAQVVGGR